MTRATRLMPDYYRFVVIFWFRCFLRSVLESFRGWGGGLPSLLCVFHSQLFWSSLFDEAFSPG